MQVDSMFKDKLTYDVVLKDPQYLTIILQFYEFVSQWLLYSINALDHRYGKRF
jgi:hypothetical protein